MPKLLARHPRIAGGVVLVLLLAALLVSEWRQRAAFLPEEGEVGDTLHVAAYGQTYKVRLIGVDTPEAYPSPKLDRDAARTKQDKATIVALGKRASDFTRRLCHGKRCRIEYDPANAARAHRDRYKRDGGAEVFVNAEIIRQGYGKALTAFDYDEARKAEFLALQREARDGERGLWGEWKP